MEEVEEARLDLQFQVWMQMIRFESQSKLFFMMVFDETW